MKRIFLITSVLISIAFITMLTDFIWGIYNNSYKIKTKEILKLIGWLALSIVTWYQYFNRK